MRKGPNPQKIEKIRTVLKMFPQGIWLRELARKTGISKSTVHLYVNKYLVREIEDTTDVKGNLIRFVRLKK